MALSASEAYPLTVDKLRQLCLEQGLDSCGPVRVLWQRLADHIKGNAMDTSSGEDATQASVPTDLVPNVVDPAPPQILFLALMAGVLIDPGSCGVVKAGFAAVLRRPGGYFEFFCSGRGNI
jgi:hypothetical protein